MTFEPLSQPITMPQLFEAQAVRAPSAIALMFNESRLTYGQLNSRADQLARFLADAGIGPGVDRGRGGGPRTACAVAILAVLKSGAAYLPLDP